MPLLAIQKMDHSGLDSKSRKTSLWTIMTVQVIEDGSLDQGTAGKDRGKLIFGYALKVESVGLTDGLDIREREKRA